MIEVIRRLAREPLVHFLLIGVCIYLLYGALTGGEDVVDERTLIVSAGDVKAMSDQWMRLWNRPPTEDELAGVIRDHVRTKVLYSEALNMGLDAGDAVIERRLAQKLEMLTKNLLTPAPPRDEVLETWYAERSNEFKEPDLYTVTHIFFDPDKRAETTLDDAQKALDELTALGSVPEDLGRFGDRFMLPNFYPGRSEMDLRKLFGTGFTAELIELEPGRWHGPVLSGYGTHLVWVHDVVINPAPVFEDVRDQVTEAWISQQIDEQSDKVLDELISRYEIVLEETEVPLLITDQAR